MMSFICRKLNGKELGYNELKMLVLVLDLLSYILTVYCINKSKIVHVLAV